MCGITGFLVEEGAIIPSDVLDRMTDAVSHRGPDDRGTWTRGRVSLGFRRLSIIDLSPAGHQPMVSRDGSTAIVFNGEVYNFLELRKALEGVPFRSRTDSEVVLELYRRHGEGCFAQLWGMFGLAIWDENRQTLLLARDRIGKKPLYYYAKGNVFVFASELKSLLEFPGLDLELDPTAIDEYFGFGYINAPRTVYRHVGKVLPGHLLRVTEGRVEERPYWELKPGTPFREDERPEAVRELRSLIDAAVKRRMISDVPLGAFLSGGVDSSTIVAFLARNSATPVTTFSIGFEESSFDETPYARLVARQFGTNHYEEFVRPNYVEVLEKILRDFDEPFGDSSALPTYVVSMIARRHVAVALSGDGGDELFGGYELHRIALGDLRFEAIPRPARSMLHAVARVYPRRVRGGGLLRRMGSASPQERYITRFMLFSESEREGLYDRRFMPAEQIRLSLDRKLKVFARGRGLDFTNQLGFHDLVEYLPGDILVKVDRMSMLNSLETRCPLLDHHIVEFAFRCPGEWKIAQGGFKLILKEAMEGILPPEILNRRKMGFGVPVKHWFSGPLYGYCREILLSRTLRDSGMFDMKTVEEILKVHKQGGRDLSSQLWLLVTFALFLESRNGRRRSVAA